MTSNLAKILEQIGQRAQSASQILAQATTETKNEALLAIARRINEQTEAILAANEADLKAGSERGLSSAMLDRTRLDAGRVRTIANSVRELINLPDPVGEVLKQWSRPNGLEISRIRVPIGVIGIIYESRPNVTSESGGPGADIHQRHERATLLADARIRLGDTNLRLADDPHRHAGKDSAPPDREEAEAGDRRNIDGAFFVLPDAKEHPGPDGRMRCSSDGENDAGRRQLRAPVDRHLRAPLDRHLRAPLDRHLPLAHQNRALVACARVALGDLNIPFTGDPHWHAHENLAPPDECDDESGPPAALVGVVVTIRRQVEA